MTYKPGELVYPAIATIYDGVNSWNDNSLAAEARGVQLRRHDAPLLVIAVSERNNIKPTLVLTSKGRLCWVLNFRLNPLGEDGW